jgi:hypothetical protein
MEQLSSHPLCNKSRSSPATVDVTRITELKQTKAHGDGNIRRPQQRFVDDISAPSATSFDTEGPSGCDGGVFVAFLLSLIRLGFSISSAPFVVKPLVERHRRDLDIEEDLTHFFGLS